MVKERVATGTGEDAESGAKTENFLDKLDADGAKAMTEMTLVERIVTKIEEQGLDLNTVFQLLDADADGVLTMA